MEEVEVDEESSSSMTSPQMRPQKKHSPDAVPPASKASGAVAAPGLETKEEPAATGAAATSASSAAACPAVETEPCGLVPVKPEESSSEDFVEEDPEQVVPAKEEDEENEEGGEESPPVPSPAAAQEDDEEEEVEVIPGPLVLKAEVKEEDSPTSPTGPMEPPVEPPVTTHARGSSDPDGLPPRKRR